MSATGGPGPILVTGGAGFIGSHVLRALARLFRGRAAEETSEDPLEGLLVLDDLSTGKKENLPSWCRLEVASIQGADVPALLESFKPQAVIHLAAQSSVPTSWQDPLADAEVNVLGLLNILKASAAVGVRKFIYASSAAVYGVPSGFPQREDDRCRPLSPYGVSKYVGEHYVRTFAGNSGFDYTILRYANVYGPRQDDRGEAGVVASFIRAAFSGRPLLIHGTGRQTRDFIYAGDVAEATVAALGSTDSGTYNISSGVETTVLEVAEIVAGLLPAPSRLVFGEARPGDITRSCLDNNRAREKLSWTPKVDLRTGIRETLASLANLGSGTSP